MYKSALCALALGVALLTAGCGQKVETVKEVVTVAVQPVGNQAIADARNTLYALKASYGAVLRTAVEYARLPSCSPPGHPTICSDDGLVKRLAVLQIKVRSSLDAAEKVVLSSSASTTVMQAALATARAAIAEFKTLTQEIK